MSEMNEYIPPTEDETVVEIAWSKKEVEANGSMSRRRFLQVFGGTAVATAGLAAFGSAAASALSTSPKSKVRVMRNFRYKGKGVEVVDIGTGETMLHVDGRQIPHHTFAKTDHGYASHLLPFQDFKNPDDLAKKLIDNDGTLFKI